MSQSWSISMLIKLQKQKRPIIITERDDLTTFQGNFYGIFEFSAGDDRHRHQVQFYDAEFKGYIDLCPTTWSRFQTLCHTLSTQSSPQKRSQEWRLKIVDKVVGIAGVYNTENILIKKTNQASSVIDNIEFPISQAQGEPGTESILENLTQSMPSINYIDQFENILDGFESNITQSQSPSYETDRDEDSENDDVMEGENQIPRSNPISNGTAPVYVVPLDHDFNLRFNPGLATFQRYQSDSEAIRQKSEKMSIGGCLLEASEPNSGNTADKIHPVIQFNIPNEGYDHVWNIREYVLTPNNADGNYYLHPSKAILNEEKLRQLAQTHQLQNISQATLDSIFVNPLVVKLSKPDLQRGAYKIRTRVFNRHSLSTRKNVPLKQFTRENNVIVDENQLSSFSLSRLKLSHKKYHLGVSLYLDGRLVNCCVSCMTTQRERSSKKYKNNPS